MILLQKDIYICALNARVAQLVERQPSKLNVAGSNPVSRSKALSKKMRFFFKFIINNTIIRVRSLC